MTYTVHSGRRATKVFVLLLFIMQVCEAQRPFVQDLKKKFTATELLNELRARGNSFRIISDLKENSLTPSRDTIPIQISKNKKLKNYATEDIYEAIRAYYDKDDRKDYYEVNEPLKKLAQKTIMIVKISRLIRSGDFYEIIAAETMGKKYNLCPGEKYSDDPVLGYCSGYAASKRTIITAAHCITNNPYFLDSVAFVFDYRNEQSGSYPKIIPKANVYFAASILNYEKNYAEGIDFCMLSVDRDIPESRISVTRSDGSVTANQRLITAGYPKGMPVKICAEGYVVNNYGNTHFLTNLDVYKGNSGGPVFDSATGIVEGIIIGGNEDFTILEVGNSAFKCRKSIQCKSNLSDCDGEKVLRASNFFRLIKE